MDGSGRLLETVDDQGNRSLPFYNLSSDLVGIRNEYNKAGTWTERFVLDAEGRPFLRAVETGPTDVARKLSVLGIAEGVTPMVEEPAVFEDETGTSWFLSNFFASATVWRSANLETVPDGEPYLRETTYALGRWLTAWMEMAPEGIWLRDDHGGARLETYDTESRLVTAEDAAGMIVSVERDAEGRPAALYIGDVAMLRYTYGADRSWTKELIDLRTGEMVYTVESEVSPEFPYQWPRESVYRPRPVTQAWLSGYAPMVEWDGVYPWDGHVVANLGGAPYALLPIDSESPEWRSITPLVEWPAGERIDYSADQVIIHLATDADGPDGRLRTLAVTLPRRPTSETLVSTFMDFMDAQLSSTVEICNIDCICITRYLKAGAYVEVRCPSQLLQIIPGGGRNYGGGGPRTPGGGPRNPGRGMPPSARQQMNVAQGRNKANDSLARYSECQALFQGYSSSNGRSILASLVFFDGEGLSDARGDMPCNRPNVSAWLSMGGPAGTGNNVNLCRRFENLSMNEAAVTLIHESLHVAGMPENPPVPTAMTSDQINLLVRKKCRL